MISSEFKRTLEKDGKKEGQVDFGIAQLRTYFEWRVLAVILGLPPMVEATCFTDKLAYGCPKIVTPTSILSTTIQCIIRRPVLWLIFPRDWLLNFAFLSLLSASRIPSTFKKQQSP